MQELYFSHLLASLQLNRLTSLKMYFVFDQDDIGKMRSLRNQIVFLVTFN